MFCSQPQRTEGASPTGDGELDDAYEYIGDTYDYFMARFGRDSFDGNGLPVHATVGVALPNAGATLGNWLWFGEGYVSDDSVGHEYTHLMLYTIPSGGLLTEALGPRTLHEGLADVFGELVDLSNTAGTDTTATRWLVGEDLDVDGYPRSMRDPASENRAARVGDNRWVSSGTKDAAYQNMGVVTRLAPMLIDGLDGGYPIGETKTAQLLYGTAQTLTRSADVAEFARQLTWVCSSFAATGRHGFTATDCAYVGEALNKIGLKVTVPTHPMNGIGYIARDPSTGRSLLVSGGTARIIGSGELFNCLAASRIVWDIGEHVTFLFQTGVWDVQLSCFDAGPRWQYASTGSGGNVPDGVIVRDGATPGHNWLVNTGGALAPIRNGGTYLCLARTNPVVWNAPDASINSWQPPVAADATCGAQANISVSPQQIGGLRVFDTVDQQLTAAGGAAPYTWTLISPTNLGISVTSTGRLQGAPKWTGRQVIDLDVRDATGVTARLKVVLTIGYGTAPPITGDVRRLTFGNANSDVIALSADGSRVLIRSQATNLTADPAVVGSQHLFVITTSTGGIVRVTPGNVAYLTGYAMAVGSGDVFFTGGPDSQSQSSYRWSATTGTVTAVPALNGGTVRSVNADGSRIVWSRYLAGVTELYVTDVATEATVELSVDTSLLYSAWSAVIDPGGTLVAYVAKPVGTNLVPFIHVATLSAAGAPLTITTDRAYSQQSEDTHGFSPDGARLSFATYSGLFSGGQGILTVSSGSVQRLGTLNQNGQVSNDVFNGRFAPAGQCMLVGSFEPDALSADRPNRGLVVWFSEWFIYDLVSSTYRRVTNTYLTDPDEAAVSNDCATVAVAASQYAVEEHYSYDDAGPSISDIYVTVLD
jgi:hypothetical protein